MLLVDRLVFYRLRFATRKIQHRVGEDWLPNAEQVNEKSGGGFRPLLGGEYIKDP